jgi:hypothetical protein
MLDHFFRSHRSSRLAAYWKAKESRYDNDLDRLLERTRELLLIEALKKQSLLKENPMRFKKAHSLAEVRRIVSIKRRNKK